MATRVGTILSDENVMKHCAIYRPIPMHLTKSVLHSTQTETQYGKKLKYPSPLSRPTNFDTLATTLTRHSGNDPEIRDRLHTSFRSALTITPANVATPPTTPPATPLAIRPATPPTVTRSIRPAGTPASSSFPLFSAGPAFDSLHEYYQREGVEPVNLSQYYAPQEVDYGNQASFYAEPLSWPDIVKFGQPQTPKPKPITLYEKARHIWHTEAALQ